MDHTRLPRVLLIGAGAFGETHLKILSNLHDQKVCRLVGVVVRDPKRRTYIAKTYNVTVFASLRTAPLNAVDAVDIVTPLSSHRTLIKKTIPYAHVFVEKPLASTAGASRDMLRLARKYRKHLMVGHVYRFHPELLSLKKQIAKKLPLSLTIQITNPIATDRGHNILLEMLHPLDIADFLFARKPDAVWSRQRARATTVTMRFGKTLVTCIQGWEGKEKIRTILCTFPHKEVRLDLQQTSSPQPLERELRTFIALLKNKKTNYPDAHVATRVGELIERAHASHSPKVPRIAVIGAGIFGSTTALELAKLGHVTLFEQHNHIMQEASLVNQYRHHWGYHYPRSGQTVEDIQQAIGPFEKKYGNAIIRKFPTYYSVAKHGSKVSAKEYIAFVQRYRLPFKIEYPAREYLDRSKVSTSLKVLEPIYNYQKLRTLVWNKLRAAKQIKLAFNSQVIHLSISSDGKKRVTIVKNGKKKIENFDFVVNCTYAYSNQLTRWLHLPPKKLRIDHVQALIVRLPIPRISLAVMDGPFTNLVPTGKDSLFTLVHIKESVLSRYVPANGLPYRTSRSLNTDAILRKSQEWFPILKDAKIVESRTVLRAVNAYREHDDARPSDIEDHGFGCFSILGGKIVNCVNTARAITELIRP